MVLRKSIMRLGTEAIALALVSIALSGAQAHGDRVGHTVNESIVPFPPNNLRDSVRAHAPRDDTTPSREAELQDDRQPVQGPFHPVFWMLQSQQPEGYRFVTQWIFGW